MIGENMKKIKILQFSITNSGSGVTKYALNNWKYINHDIFQFDFVTFSNKLDFEDEPLKEGCKVFYIKMRAEDNYKIFKEELLKVLKNGYDVIHIHISYWKSLNVEELAREAGIPKIIIHAHNSGVFDNVDREKKINQHEYIKSKINENIATDFWACSNEAADFLYGNRIRKDKIKIMKNAVDISMYMYNAVVRNKLRKKLKLDKYYIIGNVGRLSYQKKS